MIHALAGFVQSWLSHPQRMVLQEADNLNKQFVRRLRESSAKVLASKPDPDEKLRDRVVQASAGEIVRLLNDQIITSVELLLILIKESVELHNRHNLLCDEMFEAALETAEECDRVRRSSGKKNWTIEGTLARQSCLPPFFGVPISVKQSFQIKGRRSSIGFIHTRNRIAEEDGLFVAMIRQMGFIPFVRTNVPMNNMSFETCNNIYGRATNPWNSSRTPGGSSGGQGGLICGGGSLFGVGSDIGGSCRIPASFCGLNTIMSQRFSKLGQVSYGPLNDGILNVRVAYCPITRSVNDLVLFTNEINRKENYKDLTNQLALDPYFKPTAFDLEEYRSERKLVIGIAKQTQSIDSAPSYHRAIDNCAKILEQLGHQVKTITIPLTEETADYETKVWQADGCYQIIHSDFHKQPVLEETQDSYRFVRLPKIVKRILLKGLESTEKRLHAAACSSLGLSLEEYLELTGKFERHKRDMYRFWKEEQLDVLLTPAVVVPAVKHKQSPVRTKLIQKLYHAMAFSGIWNMFGYPAGVLPVTTVGWYEQYYTDKHADSITKEIKDSLEGSEGLPIGIQVIALPYRQETVLRVMRELEKILEFRSAHPYPVFERPQPAERA